MTGGLPDFLIVGAMKAGTTALYEHLQAHSRVWLPELKEPHFFVAEHNWHRGLDWYRSLFAPAPPATLVGEATTSYSKYPVFAGVPERIAGVAPEVRLVYVVRHPVERMRSQYLHEVLSGREHRSIDEALSTDRHYLDCSMYAMQTRRYLECFPRERFLIVEAEHLAAAPATVVADVVQFLGLDPEPLPDPDLQRNVTAARVGRPAPVRRLRRVPGLAAGYGLLPAPLRRRVRQASERPLPASTGVMAPDTRARLEDLLRDDVRDIVALTDGAIDGWGLSDG